MTEREPVRLVIWYGGAPTYGTAVATRTLLANLAPHIQVTIAAQSESTAEWLETARPGSPTVLVPEVRGWRSARAIAEFRSLVARLRPDVLHINSQSPGSNARYLALAGGSVRGVKTVLVEHMYGTPRRRRSKVPMHLTVRGLDAHVAPSDTAGRRIERDYGLAPGSITTIPYGVEPIPQGPGRTRHARPVVGSVSRLDKVKRVNVLIDAIASIPSADLVIVGDGGERDALEAQVARLGVADRVSFLGHTETPVLQFREFDVFAMPSSDESGPLTVLEAMSAAVPIVATDVGHVSEAVQDGIAGFVIDPTDTDALRAALLRLIDDPELRASMGAAGSARYEANYSANRMARAYEALYEELLTK